MKLVIENYKNILKHPKVYSEDERKDAWFRLAKYYIKQKKEIDNISETFGCNNLDKQIEEIKQIGELLDKRQLKLF